MVKLAIPSLLAGMLAAPLTHAGNVGATLTVDQLQLQGSGNYTVQPDYRELYSRVVNVDSYKDIAEWAIDKDSWQPLATSALHNGSQAQGSWNPLAGGGSLAVDMAEGDGPWRRGETSLWTDILLNLAPGASVTVSGRLQLAFHDSTAGGAQSSGFAGICLDLAPTTCEPDYKRGSTLGAEPGGFTDSFSLGWHNDTAYNQQLLWRTNLMVDALSPVPEPANWGMLGVGLGLLGLCRKRYRSG